MPGSCLRVLVFLHCSALTGGTRIAGHHSHVELPDKAVAVPVDCADQGIAAVGTAVLMVRVDPGYAAPPVAAASGVAGDARVIPELIAVASVRSAAALAGAQNGVLHLCHIEKSGLHQKSCVSDAGQVEHQLDHAEGYPVPAVSDDLVHLILWHNHKPDAVGDVVVLHAAAVTSHCLIGQHVALNIWSK